MAISMRSQRSIVRGLFAFCMMLGWAGSVAATETALRYYPAGPIYEFRWKLLELALAHTENEGESFRLVPYPEEVTQNRGVMLLQSGGIDVIALGTNDEREEKLHPVRIDILRGLVGFRLLVIRSADQADIAQMDDLSLRKKVTFGLNSQWADVPIMRANGFSVITSSNHENLFGMLAASRFDAFPRGLNEAQREIDGHKKNFPQFSIEKTKALYFPFPIYFWVKKENLSLADKIERGLTRSLADGSFRNLFETYHAAEISALRKESRHIIPLDNPLLPASAAPPEPQFNVGVEAI
jgi:ABC-type amino acid transport substrate-binding protein